MRKVVVNEFTSLDGVAQARGPEGEGHQRRVRPRRLGAGRVSDGSR